MGGRRLVTLDSIGEATAKAVAAHGVAVVVAPGAAVEECVASAVAALDSSSIARALRTDRNAVSPTSSRITKRLVDANEEETVMVVDVQWADGESLAVLTAQFHERADGGAGSPIVVVCRVGGIDRIAAMWATAKRLGVAVELAPEDVEQLVERGFGREQAVGIVGRTGGLPDLCRRCAAAPADDATIDAAIAEEVADRLAFLDERARISAELIAFGIDATAPGALVDVALSDAAVDDVTIEGLLQSGVMPPAVAAAVRSAATPSRRARVVALLLEHAPAGSEADLAALLLDLGDRTPEAAGLFAAMADAHAADDPARATAYATAAVGAGAAPQRVALARAVAALGTGDPFEALKLLTDVDGADVELTRAAAWSAIGDLAATGEALRRSSVQELATWRALGAGDTELDGAHDRATAGGQLASALADWLVAGLPVERVLDELRRAATRARVDPLADRWPVNADQLLALAAARHGDFDTAGRAIVAAIAERAGGAAHVRTASLLAAWLEARRGLLDAAAGALDLLASQRLSPRDRFVLDSARCALALRDAEGADLDEVIMAAGESVSAIELDLFDLDLAVEVAAAEHRHGRRRHDRLASIERVVDRAGAPVHLVADLAWARVRVALAGDELEPVSAAAEGLVALGSGLSRAPAIRDAARAVAPLATLGTGAVGSSLDVGAVIDAAHLLAEHGYAHEAARLCGVVALACGSEADARRLLKESRVWRSARARVKGAAGADRTVVRLSDQEQRVARMVIDGHTHKQIGAALFLSPKTIEHHVAHIRTKLGCASRAEMIAALRDYLAA